MVLDEGGDDHADQARLQQEEEEAILLKMPQKCIQRCDRVNEEGFYQPIHPVDTGNLSPGELSIQNLLSGVTLAGSVEWFLLRWGWDHIPSIVKLGVLRQLWSSAAGPHGLIEPLVIDLEEEDDG